MGRSIATDGLHRLCERRNRAPGATRVPWGRDVLVEPEHVVRVIDGLHHGQAVPRRAGVRGTYPLLALVAEEAGVGAAVAVLELGGEPGDPRGVLVALGRRRVVNGRHVD